MELSINGHKVVGGGTVQDVTSNMQTGFTATSVKYVVTNGLCFVFVNELKCTDTSKHPVCTGLPKAKVQCNVLIFTSTGNLVTGLMYIIENGTTLNANMNQTTSQSFATLVYPVADDWHE